MTQPPQIVRLRTIVRAEMLPDNWPDERTLEYGWRWYLLDNDKLVSPMVGQVPLPRNGVLDDVYFIPKADLMLQALHYGWRDVTPEEIRARGFALTYGKVTGPFERDYDCTPGAGAMKCARYQALAILTTTPARFAGVYEVPVVGGLIDLPTMQTIENLHTATRRQPDPKLHVSFVCTYNRGRSAMAAAMFAQQLHTRGLAERVRVSSCGTWSSSWGSPIDARGADLLRANGYSVPEDHRAMRFSRDHLNADLLVTMERNHGVALKEAGADPNRIRLLSSFDPAASPTTELQNPYSTADFTDTFHVIRAALPGLLRWVDQNCY